MWDGKFWDVIWVGKVVRSLEFRVVVLFSFVEKIK